jgi:hypothetical protein
MCYCINFYRTVSSTDLCKVEFSTLINILYQHSLFMLAQFLMLTNGVDYIIRLGGAWRSIFQRLCYTCTFTTSEACTGASVSDIRELLCAHLHRTYLGMHPHSHCQRGTQT